MKANIIRNVCVSQFLLKQNKSVVYGVTETGTKEEILTKAKGVDAIFWASLLSLDRDIIDEAGPSLKAVGVMSVGYHRIDVAELKRRGIPVGNTPNLTSDAVADIAVLLALAASRRSYEGRLKIEYNQWKLGTQWMLGRDIEGSTVGVIGLGGIGQAVVKRLKAFDVKQFLYCGPKEKNEGKELGAKFVSLDTLAKESDFVLVCCPLTAETEGMCNENFFYKMKKSAVFVNVSRGLVIDQESLIKALKEGQIFAAGLDVMTPEPLPPNHELLKLPNVVLTPHTGWALPSSMEAMAKLTAQNIIRVLNGKEMLTPIK